MRLSTTFDDSPSVGNQLLAWCECLLRGLKPGPINTFNGWLELGRHVNKGEKAITLCMPITVKTKRQGSAATKIDSVAGCDDESVEARTRTVFVFRSRWFVLCQTEGDPYVPTELPIWSESRAIQGLSIKRIDFDHSNGNCQGFARQRQVAISPVAQHPHSTLFHELAHVVLGHTTEGQLDDHDKTPKSLREVEAECVALICCESLHLPGISDCRGYIQHWLRGSRSIPKDSVQKIFKAADSILKAGYPPRPSQDSETD